MKFIAKIASYIIFLAAYSVAVFLLIDKWDDAFWTAYVFAVLPVVLSFVVTLLIEKKIATKYLTYHLWYVLFSYVVVAVIANTLFIAFHSEYNYVVPLVSNVVVLAGYAIYFIMHLRAVGAISSSIKEEQTRLQFVRIASQKLENIVNSVTDLNEQKKIEKVYDTVRNAQAVGNDAVYALECEILSDIDTLQMLADSDNFEACEKLSASIISKIRQRDSQVRTSQVV